MMAMFEVAGVFWSRLRRRSGQRLFLSVSEPRPSVMLSPTITKVLELRGARTSTLERKYLEPG